MMSTVDLLQPEEVGHAHVHVAFFNKVFHVSP